MRNLIELMESNITDDPNFRHWFAGSKIVDHNGNPLRVFHGTNKHFDDFELGHEQQDNGIYFTPDTEYASGYATSFNNNFSGSHVKPCYLSIKNPYFCLTKPTDMQLKLGNRGAFTNEVIKYLKAQGYDGVVVGITSYEFEIKYHGIEKAQEIGVFIPKQIRSAI